MKRHWQQCSPDQALGRWHAPQATLDRRGFLKLSRVAWQLLGQTRYALVLYEPETRTIGIKATRERLRSAFELRPEGKHGSAVIRVASLRSTFGVSFENTLRFNGIHLDQNATLILDLNTATEIWHGRRIGVFNKYRTEASPGPANDAVA